MTTESEALREKIVEAILDYPPNSPGGMGLMMIAIAAKFPSAAEADFDAAFEAAIERLEERAAKHTAEAADLRRLAPLFDGMPAGLSLGECARIKAADGDPLALDYLKWEAAQFGGVQ